VGLALVAGHRLQVAVVLAAGRLGGFAHGHACILVRVDALAEVNGILELLQEHGLKSKKFGIIWVVKGGNRLSVLTLHE